MPYTLAQEEIEVCGEKLVVHQASNAMDVERTFLITEASKEEIPESSDTREQYFYYVRTLLYPSLVACTEGNVPTLHEFMNSMPPEASEAWTAVARKLNPMWFRFVTEAEVAAEMEKKET